MRYSNLLAFAILFSGSVAPLAVSAQQPEAKPNENQVQTQNTPVLPERTPQQSDQARQQDNRSADDTRINQNWTTRQRGDERSDVDRMRQRQIGRMMDRCYDHNSDGRNWRRDRDDMDRGSRYSRMDREEGDYYEDRPRRRVKICVEYPNGDEFCRYRD